MGGHTLVGSLACTILLVTLQISSAIPLLQEKLPFISEYPGCPHYQVGQRQHTHSVILDENLTFIVKPSVHSISLEIAVSPDQRYQAVIHGSMIELKQCNHDGTDCKIINEGGSKSSDLLDTNKWNYINVTLEGSEITVDVNRIQNVMGNLMSVQWDQQTEHSNVNVSILQLDIPGYSLDVVVLCNETYTPAVEQMPMKPVPRTPDPFPACPAYEVKQGRPLDIKLGESFTLAVFPSEPSLQLKFASEEGFYHATIDGSMTELQKCRENATHCEMIDIGGAKDTNTLFANQWNYVTISKVDDAVTIAVDQNSNVMRKDIVMKSDQAQVTVMATNGIPSSPSSPADTSYTVRVNVCNETQHPVTKAPDAITTNSHNSAAPQGEITTKAPEPQPTTSREVWRVLAIVLAVLIIILFIILAWHCASKRCRNVDMNRLQEEQLEQMEK